MEKQEPITEVKETDMEKLRALYAIDALKKAAKIEELVAGENSETFCGRLREMAEAICQHSGLNEAILNKYDAEIQAAKTNARVPDAELSGEDIASLLEATIDLCESVDSAAEIMQRFRLVRDVMYLWGTIGE